MSTGRPSVFIIHRRGNAQIPAHGIYQALAKDGFPAGLFLEAHVSPTDEEAYGAHLRAAAYCLVVLSPGAFSGAGPDLDLFEALVEQATQSGGTVFVVASPHMENEIIPDVLESARVIDLKYTNPQEAISKLAVQYLKPLSERLALATTAQAQALLDAAKALPTIDRNGWLAQDAFEKALKLSGGRTDEKILGYSDALRLKSDFAEAYARRAANLDLKGKKKEALRDCDEALRLKPYLDIAYVNKGLILAGLDDVDSAIEAYTQAIALNPMLIAAYQNRATAYNKIGEYHAAVGDFTAALALNPQDINMLFNRGLAYVEMEKFKEAEADFTTILARKPLAEVYYNRGLARVHDDVSGALADWTEAINLDPNMLAAYHNRGLMRIGKADINGALADLERVLDLSPEEDQTEELRERIEELRAVQRGLSQLPPGMN
jgi:tetratricopeptide (TPR) repeat protein